MIKINNISKHFGELIAVKNVSLEVDKGENVAILGTSGSGKTTLLKMINRIIEPTSGSIFIQGAAVESQSIIDLRRNIGYVIQQIGLFPHYTIAENIAVVPKLLKWSASRIQGESTRLLNLLNLEPEVYLDAYPHELSGGQQQRIGLARALIADPDIILMDEPFGALDPITRKNIRKEFLHLEVLQQKTIVLVTHDVAEAFELGDRVILMDQGEIRQQGRPYDLLFHPKNAFVKEFFSGQFFELQYKVVKIVDLLPYLDTPSVSSSHDSSPIFSPQTYVYEILEVLPEYENLIGIDVAAKPLYIDQLSILTAFQRMRTNGRT